MLKLYPVFADHALFQCASVLTLRGIADAGTALEAVIARGDTVLSRGQADTAGDGTFSILLDTPAGSFDPCTITVRAGEASVTLSDVLFGELWIA